MTEFRRTNSENIDFRNLVKELDKILAVLDGDDHAFFDQFIADRRCLAEA